MVKLILVLKNNFLLSSMLNIVVLLNIYVETIINLVIQIEIFCDVFTHHYKCINLNINLQSLQMYLLSLLIYLMHPCQI